MYIGGGGALKVTRHVAGAGVRVHTRTGSAIELELQPRPKPTAAERSAGTPADRLGSRAYLANMCITGRYSNEDYAGLELLQKTISFTANISSASCGCNAAIYLVSMKQNTAPGSCGGDYYCDARQATT